MINQIHQAGQIDHIEELTRQSVHEVFLNMLSLNAVPTVADSLPEDSCGQIIGSVGFVGEATGLVYLHTGISFARMITARMLDIPEVEISDPSMINDAMGEFTNMVVGYVKSRLCDSGAICKLTIPSVLRGEKLSIESQVSFARSIIGFHVNGHRMNVEILVKQTT